MNDFKPMSRAEAVALGFFRLPQRNTLFGHPRMPGFLFRLVTTFDEAIACGAMTAVGPAFAVSYFGLDLVSAIRAGKVGEFGKPKVFETRVVERLLPSYESRAYYTSNVTRRYGSIAYVEQELEWTKFGEGGKYIGIVSKADRGLVVDQGLRSGESALAPSVSAEQRLADNIIVSSDYAGNESWKCGHSPDPLGLRLPIVSGYVQCAIPVPKRAFLERAKPGFIAEIDANDAIKRAYGSALDDLIAAATGNTHDEFRIYPVVDDDNSVVRWSVRRRDIMLRTQQNGGLDAPFDGMRLDTDVQIGGDRSLITPTESEVSRTGILTLLTSEKSRNGIPCPFWIVLSPWDGDGRRVLGEGLEIAIGDGGLPALRDSKAFVLDEIGFVKVTMAPNSDLPASSVFGPISPRVRPSASPSGALDASTRVEDEVSLRTADLKIALPNAGGTATDREQAAGATESALDMRGAELEWITPFLSEFAGYILGTVKDLDKRARSKLKG